MNVCGKAVVGVDPQDGRGACPDGFIRHRPDLCVPSIFAFNFNYTPEPCADGGDCVTGYCAEDRVCGCPAGSAGDTGDTSDPAVAAKVDDKESSAVVDDADITSAVTDEEGDVDGEEAADDEESEASPGNDAATASPEVDGGAVASAEEEDVKPGGTSFLPDPSSEDDFIEAGTAGRIEGNAPTVEGEPSCVDIAWLRARGFGPRDMVHGGGVLRRALCPGGGLPCGTEFHALQVDGKVVGYGKYCEEQACVERVVEVDTLWADYVESRRGIEVNGVKVYMHDVRYPYSAQWALHVAMRAVKLMAVGMVEQSAL
eukprot:Plantae.Rhodophyta-Palmaria_palmata.ctg12186.p1 GENE.Plantae.Rhodophyta-Palmaria_palmata.ctg12186~~Plantae.Rhodophyta-Palmaria_palmata.ctg12186.p1  ORF type:complete len:350 (+),score=68.12 Plantae.Rhodophyta-Palmaria_palmata.ctg12186:110-1051(+)